MIKVPDLVIHEAPMSRFGFSLYRGVIVFWDVDYDERICQFLDDLAAQHPRLLKRLRVAAECKGGLYLLWNGPTPKKFREKWDRKGRPNMIEVPARAEWCDAWGIGDMPEMGRLMSQRIAQKLEGQSA